MSACSGEARMSVPRQRIAFTLDDKFRVRKGIMKPGMVYIEMSTDESIDVIRTQAKCGEMLDHIFFFLASRRTLRQRIRGHPAVDQDMLPISGLDATAAQDHFHSSTLC